MSPFLKQWIALKDHMSIDLGGGPRLLKMSWGINLQKGGTMLFVLGLMVWFDNWTPAAWAYLALHGTYGLCWLLKEAVFPDPGWQRRVTFGGALMSWVMVLGPYWAIPYLLISSGTEASMARITFATVLHTLGVVTMMGADTQKYFVLRARRGLITDGWFSRVRHPNYLGEMMLYAAYAVLAQHWLPWAILAWVWLGIFLPNMLAKEASMSRYPAWAAYVARSGMVLPKLFGGGAPADAVPSR